MHSHGTRTGYAHSRSSRAAAAVCPAGRSRCWSTADACRWSAPSSTLQPRRLLWSIPALAALAVALAALRSGRSRVIRTTAWAALVVAVTSWTASWIGVLLDGRGSVLWLALAAVYALSVAGMVAAAVTAPAGDRGP